jgi:hypothetical protein
MADDQFLEAVTAVVSAVRMFLDTDAAYGPDHERTRAKKDLLAQAIAALMPDDADVPQLHVIEGGLDDDGA